MHVEREENKSGGYVVLNGESSNGNLVFMKKSEDEIFTDLYVSNSLRIFYKMSMAKRRKDKTTFSNTIFLARFLLLFVKI